MDTAQRGWWLKRMREARRYLRAVRARTAAQTSASVSTKLLLGDPGTTLVAFAHRRWVGAIVMTTHNEMRNERFFAGAVATQVVRQAPAPTLLIPLGAETETPGRITRAAAIAATP
jgi:nucleotide-binding universal stress UspA family protein